MSVTDVLAFMVTVHVRDVPVYPPDHPEKLELASGVAVKVTVVAAEKVAPEGLVMTAPVPVPALVMVRV